jgi:hypothetical protein
MRGRLAQGLWAAVELRGQRFPVARHPESGSPARISFAPTAGDRTRVIVPGFRSIARSDSM